MEFQIESGMALELTEQELKDLGFDVRDESRTSSYSTTVGFSASKSVGNGDAYFRYRNMTRTWRINQIDTIKFFGIVIIDIEGEENLVYEDIETLERFHELENCLNKK